jgi:raffinose/stachyose/melibiose transport system permease protein
MYKKRSIAVFVLPTLIIYSLIVVAPIFVSAYLGLFKWDGVQAMQFKGLGNYQKLITMDPVFRQSLVNSLILAAASIFIQLPIAFILALILSNGVKFEKLFRTVYFIPVILSSMVIAQLWLRIFNADYGLLNSFLKAVGLGKLAQPWMANTSTAFTCTVIPAIWQYVGQYILIMYAGMKAISEELYEAATIDGANGWQTMTRITIPLLSPVIKVCIIFSLTGSFKSFDLVFAMTNGGPFHSTELPSTVMYSNLFSAGAYGYGSAQAVFIVVECLVATLIIQLLFKKSEAEVSAV